MDICRPDAASVVGVILAGGRGSRMGGEDKGLVQYRNKPLYQHVLEKLRPQVSSVCISANRNLERYQESGVLVIADTLPDYPGPLAGMMAALQATDNEWLAFASCDTPALPENLVQRLWQEKGPAQAVWARTADRDHPTLALLHHNVATELAAYLAKGERRVMLFLQEIGGHAVLFEDTAAFNNINRPEDLYREEP